MNLNGGDSAVYAINDMADWTEVEHQSILGDIPIEDPNMEVKSFAPKGGDVDWRKTKHLTPVKN